MIKAISNLNFVRRRFTKFYSKNYKKNNYCGFQFKKQKENEKKNTKFKSFQRKFERFYHLTKQNLIVPIFFEQIL